MAGFQQNKHKSFHKTGKKPLQNGSFHLTMCKLKSIFLAIFWGFLFSQDLLFSTNSTRKSLIKTRRIGVNPEKPDLINFWGQDWRKFSEVWTLLFFLKKNWQNAPKIPV